MEAAHDEAVRAAFGYLEAAAAKGRRGRDGVEQVGSSGLVAAVFRQRTSRANDPHLHSRVLIANMCQGEDGRWGALDARLLYVHAKAAGYLYETHLRYRLSSQLGVDWTEVVNGIADVAGVPDGMIDLFSKRSKEIRGRLDEVTDRINEGRLRLGLPLIEATRRRRSTSRPARREPPSSSTWPPVTCGLTGTSKRRPRVTTSSTWPTRSTRGTRRQRSNRTPTFRCECRPR